MVGLYNQRGTAAQWIKEGKNAAGWTRLFCHEFIDKAVRLQLFALAYNLTNFMRWPALPDSAKHWSLTTLGEEDDRRHRLVKTWHHGLRREGTCHGLCNGGGIARRRKMASSGSDHDREIAPEASEGAGKLPVSA